VLCEVSLNQKPFENNAVCSTNCLLDITHIGYTGARIATQFAATLTTLTVYWWSSVLGCYIVWLGRNKKCLTLWRIAGPSSWWSRTLLQIAWLWATYTS